MSIINGRQLARKITSQLREAVSKLNSRPRLDILWIQDEENPGSQEATEIYIKQKQRSADKIGIMLKVHKFKDTGEGRDAFDRFKDESGTSLISTIHTLNEAAYVDGIICQIPTPDPNLVLLIREMINVTKDVDGMHPYNYGGFHLTALERHFISPTALAVYEILNSIDFEFKGRKAVVIGQGLVGGSPISQLLLSKEMTVAICHEETTAVDLVSECRSADLIVAATGCPLLVKEKWVKEGAVVVDVGINRDADGNIVGDVDFHAVRHKVSHITPVPKGVGPVTVAMLMRNTILSHMRFHGENGENKDN